MPAQPIASGRNLIFYFDISTMSKDDQTRVISAAEMFIQRNVNVEDRLAVMVGGANEVAVKQDFTNNRDRFLEAVRHIADNQAGGGNANRSTSIAAAMKLAEPLPGRKALLYFAGTVGPAPSQAEMKSLREEAANLQVAVYMIDAGGTPAR